MRKPKGAPEGQASLPVDASEERMKDAITESEYEARGRMRADDGSRHSERRRAEDALRGEEEGAGKRREGERPSSKGKTVRASKKPAVSKQGPKTVQVYARLPEAMTQAIEKAVEQSPIEFGSASEFIRRSIEHELRRRGLLPSLK